MHRHFLYVSSNNLQNKSLRWYFCERVSGGEQSLLICTKSPKTWDGERIGIFLSLSSVVMGRGEYSRTQQHWIWLDHKRPWYQAKEVRLSNRTSRKMRGRRVCPAFPHGNLCAGEEMPQSIFSLFLANDMHETSGHTLRKNPAAWIHQLTSWLQPL